jgi:hypothetical protein
MKTTTNLGFKKIELTDSPPDITVQDTNWDSIDKHLNTAVKYQKASGTGTAITLSEVTLEDGYQKTFIVTANNSSAATKINGKNLYKPGGIAAPNLISGKAVTVWYDLAGDCFFIKASAEGDAIAANVLAGKKFSNDNDTGITGAMVNNGAVNQSLPVNGNYTIPQGYHDGLGKITQTLTTKGASTITPSTADQTIVANQYLTGVQTIKGDANLVSANIKSGVSIFGKVGTSVQAEGLYNFPLSIQDDQPTAIRAGHIWVKSATLKAQINNVYIVDYPRATDGNGSLILAVGDRTYLNQSYIQSKALTDGSIKGFGDGINTSVEATWTVSRDTNGASQFINYRPPMVYSKVGGVQDIETAYMWDGSSWVMLSQKGNYVLVAGYDLLKLNNISGEATTEVQNLALPYNSSVAVSVTADGTYMVRNDSIFKRSGNLYAAYPFNKNYIAYGVSDYIKANNYPKFAFTGDGSALLVALICGNGTPNQFEVTLLTFKNDGSTFVATSYTRCRTSALSLAVITAIETDYSGDVVALSYQTNSGPTYLNYTAVLFKQSDGTYSPYTHDLANSIQAHYGVFTKHMFIGGRLYIINSTTNSNDYTSLDVKRFDINRASKTLTYILHGSIYTGFGVDTTGFAQVGTDFLIAPKPNSSPYLAGININTGTFLNVQVLGYTMGANEYSSMSIAVNANSTIAVISPFGVDYTLKFRVTYNVNTITLTFIDKIPYTKISNRASATFFLPDKSRS